MYFAISRRTLPRTAYDYRHHSHFSFPASRGVVDFLRSSLSSCERNLRRTIIIIIITEKNPYARICILYAKEREKEPSPRGVYIARELLAVKRMNIGLEWSTVKSAVTASERKRASDRQTRCTHVGYIYTCKYTCPRAAWLSSGASRSRSPSFLCCAWIHRVGGRQLAAMFSRRFPAIYLPRCFHSSTCSVWWIYRRKVRAFT